MECFSRADSVYTADLLGRHLPTGQNCSTDSRVNKKLGPATAQRREKVVIRPSDGGDIGFLSDWELIQNE